MIEPEWTHVWAFDARPWPDFPARSEIWSDGENWRLGHWLNGRAGLVPVARIIDALCDEAGLVERDVSATDDLVAGYVMDRPMPARDALAPLLDLLGVLVIESADSVRFVSAGLASGTDTLTLTDPVDAGEDSVTRIHPAPLDLVRDVALGFYDDRASYRTGHASARGALGTVATRSLIVPVIADADTARRWCGDSLMAAHAQADRLDLVLPPDFIAVEVGDRIAVDDAVWQVAALEGDAVRQAHLHRPTGQSVTAAAGATGADPALPGTAMRPALEVVDLPLLSGESRDGPLVAAWARSWPGAVDVHLFDRHAVTLTRPARLGWLAGGLPAGPVGRWDRAHAVLLDLDWGTLASAASSDVLAGANRIAVEASPGNWEVIAFSDADLLAPGRYRLTGLLRGLGNGVSLAAASGARIVVLDAASQAMTLAPHERGVPLELIAVAAGFATGDDAATRREAPAVTADLTPLAPAHLTITRMSDALRVDWIRQTRIGGDDWAAPDVPLGEEGEAWQVELDGAGVVHQLDDVTSSGLILTDGELVTVFGALPDHLTVRVAQLSARVGAGRVAEAEVNL